MMLRFHLKGIIFLGFILGGTGSATISVAQEIVPAAPGPVPTRLTKKVQVLRDERYSETEGREGLCDVYLPAARQTDERFPVVLVVHGGAWISGDKLVVSAYSQSLAAAGYVAITINYRLAPQHKFPAQVDDVRQALIWTSENTDRFSIDLSRLGMFGYSAGGHLSTLVAGLANEDIQVRRATSDWEEVDPRWKKLPTIRAVCAGGPPSDFRQWPIDNTTLAYFLGGSRREAPANYLAASPAQHVSAGDPPTQIIHGEGDLLVPVQASRKFHLTQKQAGIDSRLVTFPKQGHMIAFLNPETSKIMLSFFDEKLAPRNASDRPR